MTNIISNVNKCDLEETKYVACQKFLELVNKDKETWRQTGTMSNSSYGWHRGSPYYWEREYFRVPAAFPYCVQIAGAGAIWAFSKKDSSEFHSKMMTACAELKRRAEELAEQKLCNHILDALNPKPPAPTEIVIVEKPHPWLRGFARWAFWRKQ